MNAPDRLVTLDQAVKRLGVPRRTLYRRLADGTIPVYRHDRDRRQRLVDVADVAALFVPRSERTTADRPPAA